MLGIIDLEISNLGSVLQALNRIGVKYKVIRDVDDFSDITALIIPGVGAFADGMKSLQKRNFDESIKKLANENLPILGICLGMQLLTNKSEESGNCLGLGLIPAEVKKLNSKDSQYRVPNIGWCDTKVSKPSSLFPKELNKSIYYYVHSYHVIPKSNEYITANIDFSNIKITVAYEFQNIYGVQFHPEKSQQSGLDLLERFTSLI